MTSSIRDCLSLVLNIHDSLSPHDSWKVVNIGKSTNSTFSWPSYPSIPWSFGYSYDSVSQILEEEGVIEAKIQDAWYIGITKTSASQSDPITILARKKGYLKNDESVKYYSKWTSEHVDHGPTSVGGQFSILVNVQNLIKFYWKYNEQTLPPRPTFNETTKNLDFLGESVHFMGEIEQKSVRLLMENLNSLVSKKEFYEVRGEVGYEETVKKKRPTLVHEPLEKMFTEIKKKIMANKKLKNVLILAQQDGFGMFLNQKTLTPAPQINNPTPQ